MIKAIVFDLGGVIFHAVFDDIEVFQKFVPEWNKAKTGEITQEDFYETISKATKATKDEVKKKFLAEIKLDEDMKNLILTLKENYKIGILTNTIEDLYNEDKKLWNFEEIAEVITSFKEHVAKPHPDAIDLMLKKLGVEREDIIFVDDHPDTIEKYSNTGITCIKFTGYKQLLKKLKNMDIKI
ncbi:HAD-IA family hydrolase [archaeon]|nr:HAD-IA family hydrolase [archaeon]